MSAEQRELPVVVWDEREERGVIATDLGAYVQIGVVRRIEGVASIHSAEAVQKLTAVLPLAEAKLLRNRIGRAIKRATRSH